MGFRGYPLVRGCLLASMLALLLVMASALLPAQNADAESGQLAAGKAEFQSGETEYVLDDLGLADGESIRFGIFYGDADSIPGGIPASIDDGNVDGPSGGDGGQANKVLVPESRLTTHYDASTGFSYVYYPNGFESRIYFIDGSYVLDWTSEGTGVGITGYDGSCGTSISIPEKINGQNVIAVEWPSSASYINSMNLSNCAHLEALSIRNGFLTGLTSLDVSHCPDLKELNCIAARLTSLDISSNCKLIRLNCNDNRIADLSSLDRWLCVSGHAGMIRPQNVEVEETVHGGINQNGTLNVSFNQVLDFPIPEETDDGITIPFIGGASAQIDLTSLNSSSIVYDDDTFRILIGVSCNPEDLTEDEWALVKDYVQTGDPGKFNLLSFLHIGPNIPLRNNWLHFTQLLLEGQIIGYAEGYFENGIPHITESGAELSINRIISGDFEWPIPPTGGAASVIVGIEYGVGFDAIGQLTIDQSASEINYVTTLAEIMFPKLTFSAGVGIGKGLLGADIRLYGGISFYTSMVRDNNGNATGHIDGDAGIRLRALCFSYAAPFWQSRHDWSYNPNRVIAQSKRPSGQLGLLNVESAFSDAAFCVDESVYSESLWSGGRISRTTNEDDNSDFGTSRVFGIANDENQLLRQNNSSESPIQSIFMPETFFGASPVVASSGSGKVVAVWVATLSGCNPGCTTAAVFSVYDPLDESWSYPVVLSDNMTGDYDPAIAVYGETAYVAWVDCNATSYGSDLTLDAVARSCEVSVAEIDLEHETMTTARLTNDALIDAAPSVCVVDGSPWVAWVSYSGQSATNTGNASVYAAHKVQGTWSSSCVDTLAPVDGLAAGGLDGVGGSRPCVAYSTCDDDGYYLIVRDAASGQALGALESESPFNDVGHAAVEGDGAFVWRSEGVVCCTLDGLSAEEMGYVGDMPFDVLSDGGSSSVVYCSGDPGGSGRTYVCEQQVEDGELDGEEVALAEATGTILTLSAAAVDGGAVALYSSCDGDDLASSPTSVTAEVGALSLGDVALLSLDELYCDFGSLRPDGTIDLHATVSNRGGVAAGGLRLVTSDIDNDEVVLLPVGNSTVGAGGSAQLVFRMTLPAMDAMRDEYEFSLASSSTVAECPYGSPLSFKYADICLSALPYADGSVTCTVDNRGVVPAAARLVVRDVLGNQLYSYDLGTLARGQSTSRSISASWTDHLSWVDDPFFVEAVLIDSAQELFEENNRALLRPHRAVLEVSGSTRYKTAVEVAKRADPYGCCGVILASGVDAGYSDGAVAYGLSGLLGYPVLLTQGADIPAVTIAAVEDLLGPPDGDKAVVLVGSAASATLPQGWDEYDVELVSGSTRINTAIAAYDAHANQWGDTAVVVSGYDFPDALSVGPLAYSLGAPVFLANQSGALSAATVSRLASGAFDEILVVGGPLVISDGIGDVLEQAGFEGELVRLYGSTRYRTNAAVVRYAVGELGFSYDSVCVASGEGFPDAMCAAPLCGMRCAPLVLVSNNSGSSDYCIDNLLADDAADAGVSKVCFVGGINALSTYTRSRVLSAVGLV